MEPTIRLTAPQSKVFQDPARFRLLVAGRRFGKTTLSMPELLRMAWARGKEAWYVAPTYRQAKEIAWRKLKRLAAPYIAETNESELSIELTWGARIALRGANNYDSLRGPGLDGLILDEFADIPEEAWTEVLRPMLSDRLGKALFIGTPKGRNHFFEMWQRAKAEPGWSSYQYTTLAGGNVHLEEIQSARRDLDERTFRQEYEASFENFAGVTYYCFARERNVQRCEYDPSVPLIWTLDFNVNPMCSVIAQAIDTTDRLDTLGGRKTALVRILDELYLSNSSTPQACEEFDKRARKWFRGHPILLNVYGDASGIHRQTASAGARSDWQAVREFFANRREYKPSFKYRPANPAVRDRVAAVNAMLQNSFGEIRMLVDPKCRYLIRDFERVTWKAGAPELDKDSDGELTHLSDALGYYCESEFGLTRPGGPRSTRII